eukprot:1788695-Pyramimonas_sp.AAC.2
MHSALNRLCLSTHIATFVPESLAVGHTECSSRGTANAWRGGCRVVGQCSPLASVSKDLSSVPRSNTSLMCIYKRSCMFTRLWQVIGGNTGDYRNTKCPLSGLDLHEIKDPVQ